MMKTPAGGVSSSAFAESVGGVESGLEAVGQLTKVFRNAPARIGAVRRFRLDPDCRRLDQSLDRRHRCDQAIPLRRAERSQNGLGEGVGTTLELGDLAQSFAGQRRPPNPAIVGRGRPLPALAARASAAGG